MPEATPPPPPPPPEADHASFLQRAAPIIASERGLTPRARLLLESLARDMALSDDDFQHSIEELQRGELVAAKASDPQRARYRELLQRQLANLPAQILSARHEQTLVSLAVTQFGLADEAARDDLRQVAAQLSLRRVPYDEALRYVREIVVQKVGEQSQVDSVVRARLTSLAVDWGLDAHDVNDLISDHVADHAAAERREKLWSRGVAAGAIGALLILIVASLAMLANRWLGTTPAVNPTAVDDSGEATNTVPVRLPAWWDAELTIPATQVRNTRDDFAPVYAAIVSDDALRRAQGYQLLIDRAATPPFDAKNWKVFEPLIVGAYALDPDDAAALALREAWLRVMQQTIEVVPATAEGYQGAIQPLLSVVRTLHDNRVSAARRQAVALEASRLLRTSLAADDSDDALKKQALAALAAVLFEQLAAGLEKRPELISRHYATLAGLARERVSPVDQERLDAIVSAAAIQATPDTWRTWETILQRGLRTRDSLALLRVIDAYARCRNPELRKSLATQLVSHLGINVAGVTEENYAQAMRTALGIHRDEATDDAGRWSQLQELVARQTEKSAVRSADELVLLGTSVDLAWQVNLALALAIEHPNAAQFDRWFKEGLPSQRKAEAEPATESASATEKAGPAATPREERLPRDAQETFDRYLHELADWHKLDEARRISYLHFLAQAAERVRDVSPLQARQVAGYVLGRKTEAEQAAVLASCKTLRNWKQLRIALADGVERSPLSNEAVTQLVLACTGEVLENVGPQRSEVRQLLLRNVLAELQWAEAARVDDDPAKQLDHWAEALQSLYRQRAQLVGALPNDRMAATSATDLLRLVYTTQFRSTAAADARLLELPMLLGESDPQGVVLLQRAIIERTNDELLRRLPAQAAAAAKLVADYRTRSRASKSALAQIAAGEQIQLKLWLLYQPK